MRLRRSAVIAALTCAVVAATATPSGAQEASCPESGVKPRISQVSFAPARVPVTPDGNIIGEDVSLRFTISRAYVDDAPTAWLFDLRGRLLASAFMTPERGGTRLGCGDYTQPFGTKSRFPDEGYPERRGWFELDRAQGRMRPNQTYVLLLTAPWFDPYQRPTSTPAWAVKTFRTARAP